MQTKRAAARSAPESLDLDTVVDDVLDGLERLAVPGGHRRAYAQAAGQRPTLYGSADVAACHYVTGALDTAPMGERAAWAAHINAYQDPRSGWYADPRSGEPPPTAPPLHLCGMAVRALNALGNEPAYPTLFHRRWDEPGAVVAWLEHLDWDAPWTTSIEVVHVGMPRAQRLRRGERSMAQWCDTVLDWFDTKQDRATGYWGALTSGDRAAVYQGMGAAFHIYLLYWACDRPVPHLERIVETTLSLARPDGHFAPHERGVPAIWGDMDAVTILADALERQPSWRDRIVSAIERVPRAILRAHFEHGRLIANAHTALGFLGTIYQVGRACPEHPYAGKVGKGWRNFWDPALWDGCRW